jgi:hypothetical protein
MDCSVLAVAATGLRSAPARAATDLVDALGAIAIARVGVHAGRPADGEVIPGSLPSHATAGPPTP